MDEFDLDSELPNQSSGFGWAFTISFIVAAFTILFFLWTFEKSTTPKWLPSITEYDPNDRSHDFKVSAIHKEPLKTGEVTFQWPSPGQKINPSQTIFLKTK